jgi:hypothetical protein
MRYNMIDAQAALSFMVQQASMIEAEVYRVRYPDIQYQQLLPIDTSGGDWVKSKTFFSLDQVGAAGWLNHYSSDVRLADIERNKFEQTIELAGIGYRYTLEEVGQTMQVPNLNLSTERAEAAGRAAEEFLDNLALRGDATKGYPGLINSAAVTAEDAINDGTGSARAWTSKTADQILRDINVTALGAIYSNSLTVEMADTLLIPPAHFSLIATKRISDQSDVTVLDWVKRYNAYTAVTGRPITIRAVRGLETAGTGVVTRMVAYRNDAQVLKFHLPMPHRFLQVWQTGPIVFDVPGIFRTGGTEIRRPGAMKYVDEI